MNGFMSHFQSIVQISKMLVEICVLLEDQFKRAEGGGGGAAELKIHKSRSQGIVQLKYEAAKLLNFAFCFLNL